MNWTQFQPRNLARPAGAVGVGLLWAAAFPKLGVAGFAWLVPGLLLAATLGCCGGAVFRVGYLAGLTFWLGSLYWLLLIPVKFAPILGWLALAAFLALFPAAWAWLCWRIFPVSFQASDSCVTALADRFLSVGRLPRLRWALVCALLWVAWEMIQARILSGFPWNILGASQYRMVPVIQIAAFTGVYGVSFLMAWFSAALLGAVALMIRLPQQRQSWMIELLLPLMAVTATVSLGMKALSQKPVAGPELRIALIQPSVPQKMIWDSSEDAARLKKVIELSEQALTNHVDLVVWPESGVPGYLRWDTNVINAVTNLVRRHKVWLVLGSDDLELKAQPRPPDDCDYFNSAFLVSPDGQLVAGYRKRKLVMFGEYVPLAKGLPFLKWLTPISGGYTPGTQPGPFVLPDLRVKLSVLICFEDIFPHLVPEYVDDDTDFLLNLTNNGWFGESAAQWQHAANAVFRAVENGRPLVRCGNNGLTCWVDERGRLSEVFYPATSDIYGPGFKIVQVPLLGGGKKPPTFYRQHGDWFGWSAVALAGLLVGWSLVTRRTEVLPGN